MSKGPNLFWGYDSETGQFASLPAGPFLIPALLIVAILTQFQGLFRKRPPSYWEIAGDLVGTEEWQKYYSRYWELVHLTTTPGRENTLRELYEYDVISRYLQYPRADACHPRHFL